MRADLRPMSARSLRRSCGPGRRATTPLQPSSMSAMSARRGAGCGRMCRWGRSSTLSTQAPSPSRERQPAALSGAIRREAEEDRARASQHQRLGLEHWTRRLVGGHSAQCLSAMTPMAMPRNNKKNAGIQFGSNGTTYLHPVPFPAQKWHKIQTEARANFWTICRSATKHAPI